MECHDRCRPENTAHKRIRIRRKRKGNLTLSDSNMTVFLAYEKYENYFGFEDV